MSTLSNFSKIKYLERANEVLINNICHILPIYDIDLSYIDDPELLLEQIEKKVSLIDGMTQNRLKRAFQIWVNKEVSEPIPENSQQEALKEVCFTGSNHRISPVIEEYYGTIFDSIIESKKNILSNNGTKEVQSKTKVIYCDSPNLTITYMEAKDDSFFSNIIGTFPYAMAPTLQELFKLMLEWQWAYRVCNNTEPVAKLCNTFLINVGLDFENNGKDDVVTSLMNLPDMYVAQYIKGKTISTLSVDPPMPISFKLWCIENGVINTSAGYEIMQAYQSSLKILKNKEKLNQLR
jgi:hypothetical protein